MNTNRRGVTPVFAIILLAFLLVAGGAIAAVWLWHNKTAMQEVQANLGPPAQPTAAVSPSFSPAVQSLEGSGSSTLVDAPDHENSCHSENISERGCGTDAVDIDSFTSVPAAAGPNGSDELFYDKLHVYSLLPQEFSLQCLGYVDRASFHVLGTGKPRTVEFLEGLTGGVRNTYFADRYGVYMIEIGVIKKISSNEMTFSITSYESARYH